MYGRVFYMVNASEKVDSFKSISSNTLEKVERRLIGLKVSKQAGFCNGLLDFKIKITTGCFQVPTQNV